MTQRPLLTAYRLALMLTMLFVLNFMAFVIHCVYLGGDALSGKYEHGHYYVKSHGKYAEVTATQFNNSRRHQQSVFATLAGALLGSLLMWLGPASPTRHTPPEHAQYWTAAGILLVVMVVAARFIAPSLAWLPFAGFVLSLVGGFLEWFVREWNAETCYTNEAAGQ